MNGGKNNEINIWQSVLWDHSGRMLIPRLNMLQCLNNVDILKARLICLIFRLTLKFRCVQKNIFTAPQREGVKLFTGIFKYIYICIFIVLLHHEAEAQKINRDNHSLCTKHKRRLRRFSSPNWTQMSEKRAAACQSNVGCYNVLLKTSSTTRRHQAPRWMSSVRDKAEQISEDRKTWEPFRRSSRTSLHTIIK